MRSACSAVLLGLCVGTAEIAEAKGPPALFETCEIRSERLTVFPKWRNALARASAESRPSGEPCEPGPFRGCELRQWAAFLNTLRGTGRRGQIEAVNRYMNRRAYILDPVNYGVIDYWAAPGQFLRRNGDCEDYAIAKFLSLRALGFANANLLVVVLQDTNLGIAHAVLAVYVKDDILILDNQVADVVPARAIGHYRPIYSINETSWWLHRS